MSTQQPGKRSASWNTGDDVKLHALFKNRKLDPTQNKKKYIEPFRVEHFSHIPYRNFRTNYLRKAAQWGVEQALGGANQPAAEDDEAGLASEGEAGVEDVSGDEDEVEGMAKSKIPQGIPPKKSAPSAGTGLAEKMGKLKVNDVGDVGGCYSFDRNAPVFEKNYCKNEIDKYEVEVLVPPAEEDCFKFELREEGKEIIFWQSTPELFGEEKRMKAQMGRDQDGNRLYRKYDPRVRGHNDTVQQIRKNSQAKDNKFWGKKPQVIKLPVKCEGPPNKTLSLHKSGVEINGHPQYVMIITLVYKVAKVRIAREKAAKSFVCDDLSDDMDDEGDDGINPIGYSL